MNLKKFTFQVVAICALLALSLELLVAPVLAKPVTATAFQGSSYEAVDAYVQREMRRASIPGLAYGIVYHDQIVHLQSFGIADPSGRLVTPQTPFIIGSVAKTFTALAIRQLINQGEIELNAPVQRYIPWFRLADPEAASTITISQLLSHTSGLSHADGNQAIFFQEGSSIEELVRRLDRIHINRPVGSSQEYSNLNFLVLGQVVQMISGQPFAEYVQTNIFQPLEMKHSYFSEKEANHNGLATGYHIWYGFPVPMQADFPTGAASHGYVISSIEDMAHYLIAYLNRGSYHDVSLLLPALSSAPTKPANWYDIYWNEYSGSNDLYNQLQSGGTYNFNSVIQIMGVESEGTYGIVVLMNTRPDMLVDKVNALSISEGISSLLLNGQVEKTSVLSSLEWYLWWGLVDLGLLALVILALFELFTFRQWALRKNGNNPPSKLIFFTRTGIDLLAGVFALVVLPLWQGEPWRDLLKPYCELCPILISTGTILVTVAVVKIILSIPKQWRPSEITLAGLVLLGLIFSSIQPINVQASASMQSAGYDQIDAYVQKEMKAAGIPGLAYSIVQGDQIVHLQAFGTADSTGRPVTTQTPFLIGSVGKTITSLAIQQLISAGKVELDVPVQLYIPWFLLADAEASKQITIRHLLTHTSGLSTGDGVNLEYYQTDRFTNQEIVRGLDSIQLDRPVGSSQEYSNLNFLILGQVIEQVSGQPYEEYVQQHILTPLEMHNTYMDMAEAQHAGLAQGHRVLFGFLSPLNLPYPRGLMASGYHISTAEDMSHLLIAHLNQGRFGDISIFSRNGEAIKSKASYYDIHWLGLETIPRGFTDAQSGTTLDFSACYYILPYYHAGVVVLTNANTAEAIPTKSAQTISFDILEMFTGYSGRSTALSMKTVYIGLDLFLLGMAALPAVQIRGMRRWKEKMGSRQGNPWITFPPTFLVDFFLPLILLIGVPIIMPATLVPGMSFLGAWPFFFYVLPDISYPLLGIAGSLLIIGSTKLFWFLGRLIPRMIAKMAAQT